MRAREIDEQAASNKQRLAASGTRSKADPDWAGLGPWHVAGELVEPCEVRGARCEVHGKNARPPWPVRATGAWKCMGTSDAEPLRTGPCEKCEWD